MCAAGTSPIPLVVACGVRKVAMSAHAGWSWMGVVAVLWGCGGPPPPRFVSGQDVPEEPKPVKRADEWRFMELQRPVSVVEQQLLESVAVKIEARPDDAYMCVAREVSA